MAVASASPPVPRPGSQNKVLRVLHLLALLPVLAGGDALAPASGPHLAPQEGGRVVVLGMDGVDHRLLTRWMDAGELPNFARLREQGTAAPLMPANPAQSPVSWATLNTGRNPGKHGVFDFIRVRQGSRGPSPDIGFQEKVDVPLEAAGDPLAHAWVPWAFIGGGLLLGLLQFWFLRRRFTLALGVAAVPVALGLWLGLSVRQGFPSVFRSFGWHSLVRAEGYWVDLDRAGVPFRGQGLIVAYPADELQHGRLICGLGTPDAKAGLNSWALYTTTDKRVRRRKEYPAVPARTAEDAARPDERSGSPAGSGRIYRLEADGPGRWHSRLFGPTNQVQREHLEKRLQELQGAAGGPMAASEEIQRLQQLLKGNLLDTWVPLEVVWSPGAERLTLTVDGSSQEFALGSWSDFFRVEFAWSSWFSTRAMVRFWAEELDGALELYAAPLQIDPYAPIPGSSMCWPRDFAAELADRIGLYETLGWACQTHPVKDAELSDAAFLADIEFTYKWRRRMLEDAFQDDSWRVLFHFFGSPDRVCHMLMRHFDESHPQYDPELADREYEFFGEPIRARDAVLAIYKKMDEAVGWVLEHMGPEDTLLIVSDHGFDSFRREVNLNNWLAVEGFLKVQTTDRWGMPLMERPRTSRLAYVDWASTRAYSMAISKIYLNRARREAGGIVTDEEAPGVLDAITARLYELRDPVTGEKIVRRVYRREEIYDGPWWQDDRARGIEGAPELTIDFAPGYRAAWNSTAGGIHLRELEDEDGNVTWEADPDKVVYDNWSPWSGDHCGVDMAVVQGIFLSSRPVRPAASDQVDFYDARHLAPTVLRLVGVPVPADYDLQPLEPGD